jgi:hypothetical protein
MTRLLLSIPAPLRGALATIAAALGVEFAPEGATPVVIAMWLCGLVWELAVVRAPDADKNGVPDWIQARSPALGALLERARNAGILDDVADYIRARTLVDDVPQPRQPMDLGPREPLRRLNMDAGSHTAVGGVLLAFLLSGCGAGTLRVVADDVVCGATVEGVRVEVVDGVVCVSTLGVRVCEEVPDALR